MRPWRCGLTAVLAAALAAACHGDEARLSTDPTVAPAAAVGAAVEQALQAANTTGLAGLKLDEATLTLETGRSRVGGFELNFLIFTISHKKKKGETLVTTMNFGALEPIQGVKGTELAELKDSLAKAIANAAVLASEVHLLPLREATVKLDFVVEKESGGGLSLKVLGVDIGGDVDFEKVSKNSLEVSFSRD
jgi:hypothetical protein